MSRTGIFRFSTVVFLMIVVRASLPGLLASEKTGLVRLPPDEHLVACPLNAPANKVLKSAIETCRKGGGTWSDDMGPGCTPLWAIQFGMRAGLRRGRGDLVELGRATARALPTEADAVLSKGPSKRGGDAGVAAVYGLAGGIAAAVLDGSGVEEARLRGFLDLALKGAEHRSTGTSAVPATGLTVMLAELAPVLPGTEGSKYLDAARPLAARIDVPPLRAWALTTIARATRSEQDIATARTVIDDAAPPLDENTGRLRFAEDESHILSYHLSLVEALADMAEMTRDPADRLRAERLLQFVFSDALFDGRFIMHDRIGGKRSDRYCSGCNLHALYLVDRLYGDTWRIDPLPGSR